MRTLHRIIAGAFATFALAGSAAAQPLNDNCDAAEPISGYGTFAFDNSLATTDGVLPAGCSQIGRDVWFCWTAPESGPVRLETCALASFDTMLAVYDGCGPCPTAGGQLACNDDACSLQSRLTFMATAGNTYLLRVGNFGTTAGGAASILLESGLPSVLAGPFTNAANGNDYYLLSSSSWTFAQARAVAMGGNLATVRSLDENEFLRASVLGHDGVDRRGWIGLNDVDVEGTFVWASGEPVMFINWSGGEPNNSGGIEHYVEMFGSNGLWNDTRDNPTYLVYGLVEVAGGPNCPADWDQDGVVNSQDISAFIIDWLISVNTSTLGADFNGDGQVNSTDISAFITAWLDAVTNGC